MNSDNDIALKQVKAELVHIMKIFEENHTNREFLLKNTRQTINLCSHSIISIHRGDMKQGIAQFKKARALLKKHKQKATPELKSYLAISEQEMTEAACVIAIVQKKSIPTSKSLGVSKVAYVLGLLDAIGELKRLTLNMMRIGENKEAVRIFDVAVAMYDELAGFAVYSNSVKDIRKKIDVARILIDGMSSTITGLVDKNPKSAK